VFDWKVKRDSGGSFDIIRDTAGIFKVYYAVEGAHIRAVSTLNPRTNEFQILWDETDNDSFSPVPNGTDEAYQDEITKQWRDPTWQIQDD
jgi:hypothetical protein